MHLEIITPEKKLFEGEVESATFPGTNGSFQVLQNHAPLISSLAKGELSYSGKNHSNSMTVEGGVVEVLNNTVTVLVEKVL
jgi:F-type H+-transporting ATPase subunit epsilon